MFGTSFLKKASDGLSKGVSALQQGIDTAHAGIKETTHNVTTVLVGKEEERPASTSTVVPSNIKKNALAEKAKQIISKPSFTSLNLASIRALHQHKKVIAAKEAINDATEMGRQGMADGKNKLANMAADHALKSMEHARLHEVRTGQNNIKEANKHYFLRHAHGLAATIAHKALKRVAENDADELYGNAVDKKLNEMMNKKGGKRKHKRKTMKRKSNKRKHKKRHATKKRKHKKRHQTKKRKLKKKAHKKKAHKKKHRRTKKQRGGQCPCNSV